MKTKIKVILDQKGGMVLSVTPDERVFRALELMAEKNVGSVAVIEDEKLKGIMTERDYARKVILQGKSSPDTPVKEIMSVGAVFVRADYTVEECMALMTEHRIRHLPVVEDGKILGMISIGDLVKQLISDQEFIIKQLENFIIS